MWRGSGREVLEKEWRGRRREEWMEIKIGDGGKRKRGMDEGEGGKRDGWVEKIGDMDRNVWRRERGVNGWRGEMT